MRSTADSYSFIYLKGGIFVLNINEFLDERETGKFNGYFVKVHRKYASTMDENLCVGQKYNGIVKIYVILTID